MSGLGGVQEVVALLQEIDGMLGSIQGKTMALEQSTPALEKGVMTSQQFTRILFRMNHLMVHMGLSEDVNKAIGTIQKMVFMTRMLQMSLNMLELSTPYGIIFGLMGLASIAVTVPEMFSGYDNIRGI